MALNTKQVPAVSKKEEKKNLRPVKRKEAEQTAFFT